MSGVNGICTQTYKRSSSGKFVFSIHRYSAQGKRSDPVVLDEKLTFENGDTYSLEAILQHEGESIHKGHYIIFCDQMEFGNVVTMIEGLYMMLRNCNRILLNMFIWLCTLSRVLIALHQAVEVQIQFH